MNYLQLISLGAGIAFLSSCSQYEKKEIATLNVQQEALANHAKVKMIHSSGGPDENIDKLYYYQYTVVELESQDTFRLLCPEHLDMDSSAKTYVSITSKDKTDLLMMATLHNDGKAPTSDEELRNIRFKKIDHVMFNGEYAAIEQRPYPYVIGYAVTRYKL